METAMARKEPPTWAELHPKLHARLPSQETRRMISEITIHMATVHALRRDILDGWRFWRTPNGELRESARAFSKYVAMGVLPGVPDLILVSSEGKLHFMEFKREDGTLSREQEDFQLWAIRASLPHSVVRSVGEAMKVFRHWGAIPEEAAHCAQS
jgi:hypothetical protein